MKIINDKILTTLQDLVMINTSDIKNIQTIINCIIKFCAKLQVSIKLIKSKYCEAKSVIIEPKYLDHEKVDILFSTHLDTVNIQSKMWSSVTDPLKMKVIEDKVYGLGVCDMKGFLACLLNNIENLINDKINFVIVMTYDEEQKCKAITEVCQYINKTYKNIKFALVGEPTDLKIVNKHKGCYDTEIKIYGQAAHSSIPETGISSIEIAIYLMNYIKNMITALKDPDLTSNIGTIFGGVAINTVPDFCDFRFDLRTFSLVNIKRFFLTLENKIKTVEVEKQCEIALYKLCEIMPLDNQDSKEKNVILYATEGGFLQHLCKINTIIYGCGNIVNAHKQDEYIEIDQLNQCYEFIRNIKEYIKLNYA